jgi:hypothetical protein
MKWLQLIAVSLLSSSSLPALASDTLEKLCGDVENKAYCMVLLEGFLSGYQLGYRNGTLNASAEPSDKGPELCLPSNLTMGDMYRDIHPHLPEGLGVLDMSLFIGAVKAYSCGAND